MKVLRVYYILRTESLTSSVTEMISTLKWPSLELRQLQSRLTIFYNLVSKSLSINIPLHYYPSTYTYNTHYYHPLHFTVPRALTSYYQMSFFPKTIHDWNNLPYQIIESDSINLFLNRLSCNF